MVALHQEQVTERQARASSSRAERLRRLGVVRPAGEAKPTVPARRPLATVTNSKPAASAPVDPVQNPMAAYEHTFWCADLVSDRPFHPRRPKISDIQRAVCQHYNVTLVDLLSIRRTAKLVRPRQVAMYIAKTLLLKSLPDIAQRFGDRDHTTALHAVRKIEALVAKDVSLSDEVELLKRQLQE